MITAPLADPKAGMILFSERLALMVRITSAKKDGFRFHVLNGAWEGAVQDGQVRIADGSHRAFDKAREPETVAPEDWLGDSDFAQVLSVTRHEYDVWYMGRASGAEKLINRPITAPVPTSPDPEGEEEEGPDPVHEAVLIVSVLGQGDSLKEFENWIASLSLEQLAREMDQGELVGTSRMVGAMEIPPGEVQTRLEEMGSDASFFERVGAAGKAIPVATRISDLRDQQGWNDGSMEHLAAAFIREAGLERAFLAHLEAQAAMENGYSDEELAP